MLCVQYSSMFLPFKFNIVIFIHGDVKIFIINKWIILFWWSPLSFLNCAIIKLQNYLVQFFLIVKILQCVQYCFSQGRSQHGARGNSPPPRFQFCPDHGRSQALGQFPFKITIMPVSLISQSHYADQLVCTVVYQTNIFELYNSRFVLLYYILTSSSGA